MAIDMNRSRIEFSTELKVIKSLPTIFEGMLLRSVMEDGEGKVRPQDATASQAQAGLAIKCFKRPTTAPRVEYITVPTGAGNVSVTLSRTPVSPDTTSFAIIESSATVLSYDATPDAGGDYGISGNVITFSGNYGAVVTLCYNYTPTAKEAIALWGDSHNMLTVEGSDITGTVGVIKRGIVYTNYFDTAANWWAADIVNLAAGAGAIITRGGTGATGGFGHVVSAPTPDYPYLGVSVNFG